MGFWSFMRDMVVFDWLFGNRTKESFWERSQRENNHYTDYSHDDVFHSNEYGGYSHNDYAQPDFDDDLDSAMLDDDL